jgi:hypothetical protein
MRRLRGVCWRMAFAPACVLDAAGLDQSAVDRSLLVDVAGGRQVRQEVRSVDESHRSPSSEQVSGDSAIRQSPRIAADILCARMRGLCRA